MVDRLAYSAGVLFDEEEEIRLESEVEKAHLIESRLIRDHLQCAKPLDSPF